MTKEYFIALCVISWTGWRLHPGYKDDVGFLDIAELVRRAEELWQLMPH